MGFAFGKWIHSRIYIDSPLLEENFSQCKSFHIEMPYILQKSITFLTAQGKLGNNFAKLFH